MTALLRALQATQQFEREMYNLFEAPWERMVRAADPRAVQCAAAVTWRGWSWPQMDARKRRKEREERRRESEVAVMHLDASGNFVEMEEDEGGEGDGGGGGGGDAPEPSLAKPQSLVDMEIPEGYEVIPLPSLKQIMSPAFEPYLTGYVALEKRCGVPPSPAVAAWSPSLTLQRPLARSKMLEMLDNVMEEERVDRDGALPVLSSSLDLFLGMKNATSRCLPLSEGQTFFLLYKVRVPYNCLAFSPPLTRCAAVRTAPTGVQDGAARILPAAAGQAAQAHEQWCAAAGRSACFPPGGEAVVPAAAGGVELYKLPNHDAVEYACNVVNTCVYCAQTVPQVRASQGAGDLRLVQSQRNSNPPQPM